MTLDTSFSLFGVEFEIDPLTGIKVDSGLVGVEVDPAGSTSISTLDGELVGVDLSQGVTVDISGSEIVGVDLTQGVAVDVADELVDVETVEGVTSVDVADELVDVDLVEGIASVEVAGIPVDLGLSEGVLVGVGEESLFADLAEGVAIATDVLTEFGIDPTTLEF